MKTVCSEEEKWEEIREDWWLRRFLRSRYRMPVIALLVLLVVMAVVFLSVIPNLGGGVSITWEPDKYVTPHLGPFRNVTTHKGNITIGGKDRFLIENCQFDLTGKLVIKDRAEVIIRNAMFISNCSEGALEHLGAHPWRTRNFIVEDQGKLTVLDSQLIFCAYLYPWHAEYHGLLLYDQAVVNITDSKFTYVNGRGETVYAYNSSKLWMKNVTVSTFQPVIPLPYRTYQIKDAIAVFDQSEVEVQSSLIDEVYIQGNCTVDFSSSNVEYWRIIHDSSTVNIKDSVILQLEYFGPNSNVWLTNATIKHLMSRGKVWLQDSSIKEMYARKANVWVIWDLPLFGQMTAPYTWAPYMLPVIIFTIILVAIAVWSVRIHSRSTKSLSKCKRESHLHNCADERHVQAWWWIK